MVRFKLTLGSLAAIAAAALLFSPVSARAEYLLAPGDVIEFSAAGVSDLRQRSRIDSSGEISLPLIGQLKAAGRPISELRAEVRRVLPSKSLRRKTPQGLDIVVVDPEEITLDIAEYRPVYVNGDVSKPGEQPYRLGMTVRQAVALSGGYDLLRFRADANPIMQSADLRSEYQTLWTEFAQAQAQLWRVQAELGNRPELAKGGEDLGELPVGPSVVAQILRYESEKLASNQAAYKKDESSLTRQIQQSDEQISLVQEQLETTRQGVQLAMTELQRVQSLFERGLTPTNRVAEERRLTLLTQTQNLQATERLGQVRKEREELVRRREKLADQRRTDLSREVQEANMRLAAARTRLQAVDEKLTYAGLLKSQLTRGKGASPELLVFRKTGAGRERITADEDTEMLPGDTVEVSLKSQAGPAAAER
jgi:polysaccharide export outer membrane protein